jgi:hypothetical protein
MGKRCNAPSFVIESKAESFGEPNYCQRLVEAAKDVFIGLGLAANDEPS